MTKYRALTGLSYPGKDGGEKRVEKGRIVADLPAESVPWLLEQKRIEPVGKVVGEAGPEVLIAGQGGMPLEVKPRLGKGGE